MQLRNAVLVISIGLLTMVPAVAVFKGSVIAEVRERVGLDLIPTNLAPGATGEARLELRIEEGRMHLRARARADGLTDGLYSMCVGEGFAGENEVRGGKVDLGFEVSLETLSGLDVAVRVGQGCVGPAVLEGTVP